LGLGVLADLILRPAEEPPLLHDFNKVRGIPTMTTTVPQASSTPAEGDTAQLSQSSCASLTTALVAGFTNVNCSVQNLTANSYTVVVTYTEPGTSGCTDSNYTETCNLVLQ
jgi:hypothetical protein